jgi:hypothetical protein
MDFSTKTTPAGVQYGVTLNSWLLGGLCVLALLVFVLLLIAIAASRRKRQPNDADS